jgi:hypothetical protein
MTPAANSLYSICLFFSLCSLLKWSAYRHRRAFKFRVGVAAALSGDGR